MPTFPIRVLGLFLVLAITACTTEESNTDPPNVLFIAIDDLNDWVGPLAGNAQSITPNLDAFAKESVNFKQNYCTSPGCNPSRSTLLTGYHTYNSGMYSNYQDWRTVPKLKDAITLSRYFRENGYYTAGAGKIFHYGQVDTLAWDAYFPSIKNPMPRDSFPKERPASMTSFKYMYNMFDWSPLDIPVEATGDYHSVQYITEQMRAERDQPFFLACGIYRPHLPWYVPQAYFDRFPIENIQLPALMENDTADLGPRAKELITRGGNYHKHVVEAGQWKHAIQGYLASVAYADDMFGKLIQSLKDNGQMDNTIVVVWSDHGWQLGEKMHWRKFALWENVIRTVLMIKAPEGSNHLAEGSKNGETTNALTSLLDLYPTLVELCNLPSRPNLDEESLVPILKNPNQKDDRAVITTYDYGDYSVRKGIWHYIRYIDGSEELYQLDEDPEEWINLAKNPNYEDIKADLQAAIPKDRIPLPESSLIPLMEHHIPPVKSEAFYFSEERKEWMKRFSVE